MLRKETLFNLVFSQKYDETVNRKLWMIQEKCMNATTNLDFGADVIQLFDGLYFLLRLCDKSQNGID